MAVLSLDEFTGSGVLDGSTPDGSGVPAQAVGTWRRLSENFALRQDGDAVGLFGGGGGGGRADYLLEGSWPVEYTVTVQVPADVTCRIGVRAAIDEADEDDPFGYFFDVFGDGLGAEVSAQLSVNPGADLFDTGDLDPIPTFLATNTWSLECQGTTLRVRMNGTLLAEVTDATHATGAPAMGVLTVLEDAVITVPTTTTEFESLWDQDGDLGSVEWFVDAGVSTGLGSQNNRLIYARITGPEGVTNADSTITRVIAGLEPDTFYTIAARRMTRVCGVAGEVPTHFPENMYLASGTSDGAGNLTVVLPFSWNRAALAWTAAVIDTIVEQEGAVTGDFDLDAQGLGTITLTSIDEANQFTQTVAANIELAGVGDNAHEESVVQRGVPWRQWMTRVGVGPLVHTAPFDRTTPGSQEDFDELTFPYTWSQGLSGLIFFETTDLVLTHTLDDQIVGGDTFYGEVLIFQPADGVEWFKVESGVPCTGPPSNPYPTDPPPVDQTGLIREWPMQAGAWRVPLVPSTPMRHGAWRVLDVPPGAVRKWVMARGAWRPILFFDGDTIPEPDTPEPPFHDPCNLLPPTVPPDPGDLDPLTSRFFGMSAAPPSVMGPLFTGTQIALGAWTLGQLAQFATNEWKLVTGQGSRNNYLLNGRFDKAAFIAGTHAKVAALYTGLSSYTATSYVGHSMVDDFNSFALWPPSGISPAHMADILSEMKTTYPGIRWGIRAFPSQFSSNIGFEFYSAQYRYNLGSAFAWAAQQYALAQAWGAYLMLDLNFLHGGNGSSGIRYFNGTIKGQGPNNWFMSAAEVESYLLDMYAGAQSVDPNVPLLIGTKGYQYYPPFLATPGMLAALVAGRNAMAALPALP